MVDGFHAERLHDVFQTAFVLHRTQKRQNFNIDALPPRQILQFSFDGVERIFGQFEQYQLRRTAADYLAAQFRTDRAARTRYHHRFAFDVTRHQFGHRLNRLASQQVGHRYFFQKADVDAAVHQILHARNRQHFAGVSLKALQDFPPPFRTRAGHSQQDFLHAVARNQIGGFRRPEHGQIADDGMLQSRIVVHKGHGAVFVHLLHRFNQLPPRLPRAVHDDGCGGIAFAAFGQNQPQQQTRTGNQHHHQEEEHHRQSQAQLLFKQKNAEEKQQHGCETAEQRNRQNPQADVARYGAVQTQPHKQQNRKHRCGRQSLPVGGVVPFVVVIGFQALGKPEGAENQHRVVDDEQDFFGTARQGEQGFEHHEWAIGCRVR